MMTSQNLDIFRLELAFRLEKIAYASVLSLQSNGNIWAIQCNNDNVPRRSLSSRKDCNVHELTVVFCAVR